jgi:hypothetical protein
MQIDTIKNIYVKIDGITIEREKNKGTSALTPPFVEGSSQIQRSIMNGITYFILGFD